MTSTAKWTRRSLYALALGAVVGGLLLTGVYFSARYVPAAYREALEDENVTVESAEEFKVRTSDFMERIEESDDWTESFTEQQINSWLAYEFPKLNRDCGPHEVSQPRVRFKDGVIFAACQYEGDEFSGVLSLEVRPRVTESRQVALELLSMKAGLIPIPRERLLREISGESELRGWSLNLVEIEDQDVLVISPPPSEESLPRLASIKVERQEITLRGESGQADFPKLSRLPDQSEAESESSN